MKKVLVLLLGLTLGFTSCSKEDNDVSLNPELEAIYGTWENQSPASTIQLDFSSSKKFTITQTIDGITDYSYTGVWEYPEYGRFNVEFDSETIFDFNALVIKFYVIPNGPSEYMADVVIRDRGGNIYVKGQGFIKVQER